MFREALQADFVRGNINFIRFLKHFLNCEHLLTDVFCMTEYKLRKLLKKICKSFRKSLRKIFVHVKRAKNVRLGMSLRLYVSNNHA